MTQKSICEVGLCGRELKPGTGSKGGAMICDRCKSAKYNARKLGEGALLARAEQLEYWRERIEYLAPIVARNRKRVLERLEGIREEAARVVEQRARELRTRQREQLKAVNVH